MDGANAASAASTKRASSLVLRIGSSLVLIPVLIVPVYWSVWATACLVIVAALFALVELYRALQHADYQPRMLVGILVTLLLCCAPLLPVAASGFPTLAAVITLTIILALVSELPRREHAGSLAAWALTFAGAYYIGGLLSHFILLRQIATPLEGGWLAWLRIPPGAAWIFLVLAITWAQDSAAYLVGRRLGRHKMAPYLSPNKTWEGAAGGFVASIVAALLLTPLVGLPINWVAAALLGAIGGIVGPIGDLAESLIKRQVGVKDAGHVIPGHGGVLDRADSLLFIGPILYYIILLFLA